LLLNLVMDLTEVAAMEPAIRLLREGVDRHPGDFWLNYLLGLCLSATRPQDDQGIRSLFVARALRPEAGFVEIALGSALQLRGQPDDAILFLTRGLAREPNSPMGHLALGGALQKKGRTPEAIDAMRKAVAVEPDSAIAHLALGTALHAGNRPREAIQHL